MYEELEKHIVPQGEWRPFPKASEREGWEALKENTDARPMAQSIIKQAEEMAQEPTPQLPATLYMEFMRNGNRSHYQDPCFKKRRVLTTLALAECIEHEGRFLDPLVDVIWSICEESSWCIPAHNYTVEQPEIEKIELPDVRYPIVDLFAAGTGLSISEVYYLLAKELKEICIRIPDRIRYEVDNRILTPYLERDDWWWLGFKSGRKMNNWTAVCNAGVTACAMYVEEDEARLAKLVRRILDSMEHFLACYGPDGGCDEGPSYWNYGVGHMVILAEFMLSRTNGYVNLYEDRRVAAMAEFPHRVHLTGPYGVNFSDCPAKPVFNVPVLRRYAERVGSEGLRALAASAELQQTGGNARRDDLRRLFWMPAKVRAEELPEESDVWFPDLQWLISRLHPGDPESLILAAKAGNNAEKHNHNDGGAFMVYAEGRPLVIDLGAETYTRFTFSPHRYSRLSTRSLGHNVPLVKGIEQRQGAEFKATDVKFDSDGSLSSLRQNLAGFYPDEAGINSWTRTVTLNRTERTVELRDAYDLSGDCAEFAIPFYIPLKCSLLRTGLAAFEDETVRLEITYDPDKAGAGLELIELDNESMVNAWGTHLTRFWIRAENSAPKGELAVTFRPSRRRI